MIEVVIVGIGVIPPASVPLVLLKERTGERVLPIGIGRLEAQAIALPLQGVHPPRPMTHDTFVEVLRDLGAHLLSVQVTDLTDSTFYARLTLEHAGRQRVVDMRPSDAIALAVRTETPIYVAESVMDQAGLIPDQPESSASGESAVESKEAEQSRLAPFKEFIDTLDLDDLGGVGPDPEPR
jgi:uncharacterized protein